MPPDFIIRISRSISPFVTAGPNHHQRIMMRASSGGSLKPRSRSLTVAVCADTFGGKPIGQPKASTNRTIRQLGSTRHVCAVFIRIVIAENERTPLQKRYDTEWLVTSHSHCSLADGFGRGLTVAKRCK